MFKIASPFPPPAGFANTYAAKVDLGSFDGLWMFYANDHLDDDTLVGSAEFDGDVQIGRFSYSSSDGLSKPYAWNSLGIKLLFGTGVDSFGAALTFVDNVGVAWPFSGLADHWHIFAHGYHWVACSLTGVARSGGTLSEGIGVLLIKFLVDSSGSPYMLDSAGGVTGPQYLLLHTTRSTGKDDYYTGGTGTLVLKHPTNDLFLVQTRDPGRGPSIVVGIRNQSETELEPPTTPADDDGHLLYTVTKDMTTYIDSFSMYGPLVSDHQNLASATRHPGSKAIGMAVEDWPMYRVLAPTVFVSMYPNELLLLNMNGWWDQIGTAEVVLSGLGLTSSNYTMAAEAWAADGCRALVYRINLAYLPDAPPASGPVADAIAAYAREGITLDPANHGQIWLRTYNFFGTQTHAEQLTECGLTDGSTAQQWGFRPHVMYWAAKGLMVISWDGLDSDGTHRTCYVWTCTL